MTYGDPKCRLGSSRRVYPEPSYDPAYNELFHEAAGSPRNAIRGQSSLKAYSDQEFNSLYDGMAGLDCTAQQKHHPKELREDGRRHFPGGQGGHAVDELLRASSKPLVEPEHQSVYEKRYAGAAGGASGLKQQPHMLNDEAYSSQARMGPRLGAGPSQVDDIVFGHDIDKSGQMIEKMKACVVPGAAGTQSIGASPRNETFPDMPLKRRLPTMGNSAVDEVVFGHDIDNSSNPVHQQNKEEVFWGAAGNQSVRARVRQEGRKHIGAGISQVDEIVLGTDLDNSENLTYGSRHDYAGRRCVGVVHRPEGKRHLPAVCALSQVDELVWGRDIDESSKVAQAQSHKEEFQGVAGYQNRQSPRQGGLLLDERWDKGRRHAHLVTTVDEVLTGRHIDGSIQPRPLAELPKASTKQFQEEVFAALASEQGAPVPAGLGGLGASPRQEGRRLLQQEEFQGAAGVHLVGAPPRPEGKRYLGFQANSQVDEVVWGKDIDGSRDKPQTYQAFQGAAGIQCVGATASYQGKRLAGVGQHQSQMDELIWNTDIDRSTAQPAQQVGGAGLPSANLPRGHIGLDIRIHEAHEQARAYIPDRAYQAKNVLEIGRNNMESRSFPHIMSDDRY